MRVKTQRDLPLEACDLKFSSHGNATQFEGYASVWGRVDYYGDTVLKGAFAGTLTKRRPLMLYGHNPNRVIGKFVDYAEDDKGLRVMGELTPGHSEAADVAASLKHGAITGLSIGGYTEDWEATKEGGRVIKSFDLHEISIVSMPAEDEARIDTASVKSMLDGCETIRDIERALRDGAGLSSAAATALVAKMRAILRREVATDAARDLEEKEAGELADFLRSFKLPTFEG